jgi:hypothetical protein
VHPIESGVLCKQCSINHENYVDKCRLQIVDDEAAELTTAIKLAGPILGLAREINGVFKKSKREKRVSESHILEYLQAVYSAMKLTLCHWRKEYKGSAGKRLHLKYTILGQTSVSTEPAQRKLLWNIRKMIIYNLIENQDAENLTKNGIMTIITQPGRVLSQTLVTLPQKLYFFIPLTGKSVPSRLESYVCRVRVGDKGSHGHKESPIQLPCGHILGNRCAETRFPEKDCCPYCRKVFSKEEFHWPGIDKKNKTGIPPWVWALEGANGGDLDESDEDE